MINNIKNLLDNYRIIIPPIQRDYAQGRDLEREKNVRKNLLEAIFPVITGKNNDVLRLNYIYGIPHVLEKDTKMVLIDGQQRVTTLYLLWLYLAYNANTPIDSVRLVYESRTTSQYFCEFLIENSSVLKCSGNSIHRAITNERAFYKKWLNDPTIEGMIRMLDDINKKAISEGISDWSSCLCNLERIEFSFISLDGFKREEELYATMNGRGKQLTEFEIKKPELISKFSMLNTLAEDINEKWIPAFWELAERRFDNNGVIDYLSVENLHDTYLYNYFCFVLSMLYSEKVEVPKGEDFSDSVKHFEWLLSGAKEREEDIKFISFTMNSFKSLFVDDTSAFAIITDKYTSGTTSVFFEGVETYRIVDECCEGKIKLLPRCILWALLKYKYNEFNNNLGNKDLNAYFSLMRDFYAEAWDSNTPLSITKNPTAFNVANKTLKPFARVISGDEKVTVQAARFWNYDSNDQLILNNPLSRGRSKNLENVFSKSSVAKKHFVDNLDKIYTNLGHVAFEMFAKDCSSTYTYWDYSYRRFIPWSGTFFKSLFSMTSWTNENWYSDLLDKLCTIDLDENSQKTYSITDWQYYVEKYPGFCKDNTFSAFDQTIANGEITFDSNSIYGAKATKRQVKTAFLYVAFKKKGDIDMDFFDFVEKHKAAIKKNDKDEWIFEYDGSTNVWDNKTDFVEFIEGNLK